MDRKSKCGRVVGGYPGQRAKKDNKEAKGERDRKGEKARVN